MKIARLDLKTINALAKDLGIEQPMRFISHIGPFTKPCNCPNPVHKDRVFDGFHTVIDGTHEITINVKRTAQAVSLDVAHELRHAAQWERGQRARHDNTVAYKEDSRERDADAFALRIRRSGLKLAR